MQQISKYRLGLGMTSAVNRLEVRPLLEEFRILGLHGRKDISFTTEDSASILMARNGSGKTTLLAAINADLPSNFYKLTDFTFESIVFKLRDSEQVTITDSDMVELKLGVSESQISKIASDCNLSVQYVLEVAQSIGEGASFSRYQFHPGMRELYDRHPSLGHKAIYEALMQSIKYMYTRVPNISIAMDNVKSVIGDYDIVYLPTYRRIEMSLPRLQTESRRVNHWGESQRSGGNLLPSEIKFGLSDISERLQEIFLEIQRKSNTTYQKISANIINELLDGSFAETSSEDGRPDKEELELFFDRIRASRSRNVAQIALPDIEKIYSGDFDEGVKPFLLYFLSNLNEAIKSTKPLEDRVNGFLVACNNYLMDADSTAFKEGGLSISSPENKKIEINRANFRPFFTSGQQGAPIRIDALSSGEKQVVSLFARLFLYEKKKIILFDEPELSLSIGWQTKLIPDLCRSPDFAQMIAITHSPFIFDNEMDQFAGNLDVISRDYVSPESEFNEFLPDIDDLFSDEVDGGEGTLF